MDNVLVNEVVDFYDKYPLGWRSTSRGQLILTDRRLVYIKFDHRWSSWGTGESMILIGQDYANEIDEAMQKTWSLVIPIEQVIETKIEHKIGLPFLHVTYRTATTEESACFLRVTTGRLNPFAAYDSGPLKHIANLIDESKKSAQSDSPTK
ncbi:MAG: hypothetical protein ACLPY5_04580 [Candidatus Bathyarchaeia archaeon]